VDPAPLPILAQARPGPPSGSVSAADVIGFAHDRRADQAPAHKRVDPRSSPPSGDDLSVVQLALSDPASPNKREGPGSCDPRGRWHL
jgi:hypothetical protein